VTQKIMATGLQPGGVTSLKEVFKPKPVQVILWNQKQSPAQASSSSQDL
jgi:hypothetical protein